LKGLAQKTLYLIVAPRCEEQFALESMQLRRKPTLIAVVGRFGYEPQSILDFSGNEMRFRSSGKTV
jgi:hypothetical protein